MTKQTATTACHFRRERWKGVFLVTPKVWNSGAAGGQWHGALLPTAVVFKLTDQLLHCPRLRYSWKMAFVSSAENRFVPSTE